MVANITTGKDIYGALAYNQRKVDRGKGTVLATSNIRFPADGRFGVAALADELLRWMPSHIRTEKPVVHISLNPDPEDRLSDDELTDIAAEYMEGMGWGGQPYVVYKHTDIDRPHIHIVTVQVDSSGRKIGDSRRNERSVAETEKIERKYGLHRAKGRKRGELRALLSLYRIGVEEVGGTRCGRSYRGLLYTVLDENGEKTQAAPLKASRLGDDASLTKIERVMASSGEKSEGKKLHELTRHRVGEALLDTMDETELRERLRERHIDLCLRRNDTGRITGATFIDHETRCVFNGSRLGKAFSANALHERFAAGRKTEPEQLRQSRRRPQIRKTYPSRRK